MVLDHTKIYAFVCTEKGHGILSIGDSPTNQLPLVFMNKENARELIPTVKHMYGGVGKQVELREYHMHSTVELVCTKEVHAKQ